MIHIERLRKSLGRDFTLEIDALDVERGDRVALVGMNGSGKSTLLRLFAGEIKPDSGSLEIAVPRSGTGYEPQDPYAFRGSAEYNIRLVPRCPADISSILGDCRLTELAKKKMTELSGGERQRVFLARMLAGRYDLLLLDEPLSAADLKTGSEMCSVLLRHCEETGATLVFSTHLPRQAFELANKVILLDGGRVAESGPASEMRSPASEFGKDFFSLWNK